MGEQTKNSTLGHSALFERVMFMICVVLIFGSFLYPLLSRSDLQQVQAKDGVLDLTRVTFDEQTAIPLDGEWRFYWRQYVSQAEQVAQMSQTAATSERIQVPGAWNYQGFDTQGYATFHLKIILPEERRGTFGVKTRNIRSANRLYVNGQPEGQTGVTGIDQASTIEKNNPYAVYFEVEDRELELFLQVASFEGFSSGISHSIYFGTEQAIHRLDNYYLILDVVFISSFLLAAIYFLSIYLQRRQFREQLYFSAFCFSICFYFLTTSERLLWDLFPDISMLWNLFIQIASSMLVAMFLSLYVYSSFPAYYPKIVIRSIVAGTLIILSSLWLLPVSLYYLSTVAIMVFMVGSLLLILYYLGRVIRDRVPGVMYIIIAFLAILILFPMAILNVLWTVDLYYFFPLSVPVLAISQALYMSYKYTRSFEAVTELSGKLQSLDRLKDEFLAKTSHELKTPLNGIINISQALLEGAGGQLNAEQHGDVRLMRDIGRRLANLVNDILDYSKAKNQQLRMVKRTFDLHAVVAAVEEIFTFSHQRPNITMINRVEADVFYVFADENRVTQMVSNLLDNALKYTERGKVEMRAEMRDGMVWMAVQDTGRGIAPEDQERVFASFEQLESSLTREHGGVGLGLAITKQLVELHGGQMAVESVVGEGTTMWFSLPFADRETLPAESDDWLEPVEVMRNGNVQTLIAVTEESALADEGQSSEQAYRILLVDDELSNRRAIGGLLELDGYQIQMAESGQEALDLIHKNVTFDLVILDVMMPGLSGYEVCKKIRERFSPLQLPILFLTARSLPGDLQFGLELGANDFVEKPFDSIELRSRVKTLVQLKRSSTDLVNLELSLLQSQMRPHFIYNVMSTVIGLCYREPKAAADLLMEFSQFLRQSMRHLGEPGLITLADELNIVDAYLAIEHVRFGELIEVQMQVDEEAKQSMLPPLTIQPLVENAVKHGLLGLERGGRLEISARVSGAWVDVMIRDDGKGISADMLSSMGQRRLTPGLDSEGLALYSINRRLLSLTGEGLMFESVPGVGTTVRFRVPL